MTQTETDHGDPASFAWTFTKQNSNALQRANVLGRASKAAGKYKNWFNLQHIKHDGTDGQKESVDMSCVDNLHIESTDRETDVLITK